MTILEMLGQSGILTLLGIGLVFAFLIIMVIVISLAGRAFHTTGAGQDAVGKPAGGNKAGSSNNAAITAAIVAAVGAYRNSNKKG